MTTNLISYNQPTDRSDMYLTPAAARAWNTSRAFQAANSVRNATLSPVRLFRMAMPTQPNIQIVNETSYRENYANSVQVRVNVWDFFLVFGTMQQRSEAEVEIHNFQGIYLSPQQAKALMAILQQNVSNYENTFGEIKLDPKMANAGPIN